jgi:hypothetical protein
MSFAAITLCVASQRVFIVDYFVIDSVRKLLDTPSYIIHRLRSVTVVLVELFETRMLLHLMDSSVHFFALSVPMITHFPIQPADGLV